MSITPNQSITSIPNRLIPDHPIPNRPIPNRLIPNRLTLRPGAHR